MHNEEKPYDRPSIEQGGLYRRYFKRPMDFILSLVAIIVLSPILLTVAVLVRIKLGSPVIFKQKRPGLNEKIFTLYKFRTMANERDKNGELLPDLVRINKFGKMLRATSLDELPELFNILIGDMSIIGPRPLLVRYLPYYTDRERLRHSIRPGLTGYAQVHGRNTASWEDKFDMDVWYVENINFATDVKVIFDTIKAVFSHDGVALNALEDLDEYRKYSFTDSADRI